MKEKSLSKHLYGMFQNTSIRNKFLLINTAIWLLTSVFLALATTYTLRQDNIRRIRSDYNTVMEQSVNNIETIFDSAASFSKIIASNTWIQEYYHESNYSNKTAEQKALIQSFLNTIVKPKSAISSIIIYGLDGRVVSSSLDTQSIVPQIADQESFGQLVSRFQEDWGASVYLTSGQQSYNNLSKEEDYVSLVKPVISTASGNLVALLEINFLESTISESLATIHPSDSAEVFIADDGGSVISSPSKEEIGGSIADTALYETLEQNLSSSYFNQFVKESGKEFLVCMRKFSALDWYIISRIPSSTIYSQGNHQALMILLIILFSLLLSVPASLAAANTIGKPIQDLCACMDEAALGNLDVEIPSYGDNEIGRLSRRFSSMLTQISSLILQVTQEKLARRESQLLALQAQINPHFLYNTLESISSLISLKLYEEAVRMTHSLELFYKTSLNSGQNVITLEKELQNVENYLEIQKIRYPSLFTYSIECPDDIRSNVIAKLTIQPLVENAIYHGIRQQTRKGFIRIACSRLGECIRISVSDNGPGFDKNKLPLILSTPSDSYGLFNVNERIHLYFGSSYGVSIEEPGAGGATVTVCIPAVTASTETTIKLRTQGGSYDPDNHC